MRGLWIPTAKFPILIHVAALASNVLISLRVQSPWRQWKMHSFRESRRLRSQTALRNRELYPSRWGEKAPLLSAKGKKKKRLETTTRIKNQGGRLLAGDIFGAASAGFTRMRLWVAFQNVLFGSGEQRGGFSFIPPCSSLKGHPSALNPSSSQCCITLGS